jgi:hypothetical protein
MRDPTCAPRTCSQVSDGNDCSSAQRKRQIYLQLHGSPPTFGAQQEHHLLPRTPPRMSNMPPTAQA